MELTEQQTETAVGCGKKRQTRNKDRSKEAEVKIFLAAYLRQEHAIPNHNAA